MTIADFTVTTADGATQPLAAFAGQVLLVVNTASRCGFTPQYAGLQDLHRRFAPRGFSVLAFPCNQFGGQEPGTNTQIGEFCALNYQVEFPVFARIDVNGTGADPLYRWLAAARPGLLGTRAIKWNFTKFLVGRNGEVQQRYAPSTKPADLAAPIGHALDD